MVLHRWCYTVLVLSLAAEALLTIRGFLGLEQNNPVYEVIYERLRRLEEGWHASKVLSREMVDELIKLMNEVMSYRREREALSLSERLMYDIKRFMSSRFQVSVMKLDNTERAVQEVIRKYGSEVRASFYESDRRNLRMALLKDLLRALKGVNSGDVRQVAYNLASYIEGEVLHELQRRH